MKPNKKGYIFITFGILLTLSAFLLAGYNKAIQFKAEKTSKGIVKQLEALNITPLHIKNPDMEMPVEKADGYDCVGILEIPDLNLKLPVLSEWNYKNLRAAPCRYTGNIYNDNLIICAHNYNKHFGNIKKLKIGDKVTFTDMYGNVFRFKVNSEETVKPDAENIKTGNWDLTLFTCNSAGNARIAVRCIRDI